MSNNEITLEALITSLEKQETRLAELEAIEAIKQLMSASEEVGISTVQCLPSPPRALPS